MTSQFLKFIRKLFLCIPFKPSSNGQDMQEEDRNPLVRDAPVTSFPSRRGSLHPAPPPVTDTVDEGVASVKTTVSESKAAATPLSQSGIERSYEDEDGDENAPSTSDAHTVDITAPQEALPGADDFVREPETMSNHKLPSFRPRGRKTAKPSPTPTEEEESEETSGPAAKDGLYGRPSKPFSSSSTTSKPKPKPKPKP
ncbi:uncharacterized protein STEHIDRAFT_121615 [Stereum hirsutum FP-91666 SS1]|uniref:uncharacterized protein n=1 Tax=Stereum hirsutum (strain FP-91666) TaxID=721885 RepID=UPI0004449830|nr:uncharacterized protein STEHIDRAFT_121615 [Stereum hirsutum FP-91666 SS1]EIM86761.1 hypothetical protein STEHIDRAFT_121615 [Stereum hirsutum FP-91666 SS1]